MIGTQLGEFQILEPLVQLRPAAPGSEYHLAASADGSRVVVQIFPARLAQDRARLELLRVSLGKVAALFHPNIVPILGSGIHEGRPYVLMPLPAAATLEDRWESGVIRLLDSARVMDEVAQALAFAHARDTVHGSLTPSVIWFDDSGRVLVAGLGQARAFQGLDIGGEAPAASDQYSSPELVAGGSATPATDQYSIGVIALELLSGQRGPKAWRALALRPETGHPSVRVGRPTESVLSGPELSSGVTDVLRRVLNSDPTARYPSVEVFNHQLRVSLGIEAPPPVVVVTTAPRPAPRRRRLAALAPLLATLVCMAIAVPAFSANLFGDRGNNPIPTATSNAAGISIFLPTQSVSQPGQEANSDLLLSSSPTPTAPVDSSTVDAASTPLTPASLAPTSPPAAGVPAATYTPAALIPVPNNTSAPAPTSPPSSPTPPPPSEPTIDSKKCRDQPSHPHYCTPVP
ncbi:MAG: protein kinase [Anaerolineales bacterium]